MGSEMCIRDRILRRGKRVSTQFNFTECCITSGFIGFKRGGAYQVCLHDSYVQSGTNPGADCLTYGDSYSRYHVNDIRWSSF